MDAYRSTGERRLRWEKLSFRYVVSPNKRVYNLNRKPNSENKFSLKIMLPFMEYYPSEIFSSPSNDFVSYDTEYPELKEHFHLLSNIKQVVRITDMCMCYSKSGPTIYLVIKPENRDSLDSLKLLFEKYSFLPFTS